MINKILIANRGEIACRIIKTCKSKGIQTVAVYSDADKNALHVQLADEAVWIGESAPASSYLKMDKLIQIAKSTYSDAIHPGYGFLAENANFAQLCQDHGIIFIGPNPKAIQAMGSKKEAKDLVEKYNVPTIPGYKGSDQSLETLQIEAQKIGFPLLIKAAAGGGGKGMRIVRKSEEFTEALSAAKREALSAFGDDTILLEKYFDTSRHIEVQIFGDKHGNIIHFFERECSIQRRYQKIIEEAPSPALTPELRKQITQSAINAAKAIQYDNAGTVEFLLDDQNHFYFLEINTRIQVEHPVTELITNTDLIALQIHVADGGKLPEQPKEFHGHAIECRIYAEDPYNDFMPRNGKLLKFHIPDLVRVDTGVQTGDTISIYYDPMIAKMISYGQNREEAIRKMIYTLKNSTIQGLNNNQSFLIQIFQHPEFQKANLSTSFIKNYENDLNPNIQKEFYAFAALIYQSLNTPLSLPFLPRGWRNNKYQLSFETFKIQQENYKLEYEWINDTTLKIFYNQNEFFMDRVQLFQNQLVFFVNQIKYSFEVQTTEKGFEVNQNGINLEIEYIEKLPDTNQQEDKNAYISQMPGEIIKVLVQEGQEVEEGTPLLVLISMKMENTIYAHTKGIVKEIFVSEKSFVEAKSQLIKIESLN